MISGLSEALSLYAIRDKDGLKLYHDLARKKAANTDGSAAMFHPAARSQCAPARRALIRMITDTIL